MLHGGEAEAASSDPVGVPRLVLTGGQIQFFHDNGYLSVPSVSGREEIESLIALYDRMFERRVGFSDGNYFDFVGDDSKPAALPQILMPSTYEPSLKQTQIYRNCFAAARQILGDGTQFMFDHATMKPGGGPATPWHQDEAFYPAGARFTSITFWVALQPVRRETGCLKFVATSNNGPLFEHRPINNDRRVHGLEAIGVIEDRRVQYCPLEAGGCTIHHRLTLHGADANATETPRRAYAIGFGTRQRNPVVAREFPWNRMKATAREARFLASLSPFQRLKEEIRLRWSKLRSRPDGA